MRASTGTLAAYLNTLRASPDAQAFVADCFTFTLLTGAILTYTNADLPVTLNGYVYAANSILVDGLKFKCAAGLSVDQQQITIAARQTDTIGGIPIFAGDAQRRPRRRRDPAGARISEFMVGRRPRGSDRKRDSVQGPRRLCRQHRPDFGGDHCQFRSRSARYRHAAQSLCAELPACALRFGLRPRQKRAQRERNRQGPAHRRRRSTGRAHRALYAQGTITFSSGPNTGATANVKNADAGALYLSYPLPNPPSAGDAFTVYQGCDHTQATCQNKFNNLSNFRGFPYVPPPTFAY